jgi:N-methylhydantoinase A/oxoprolinase/acetone carboxylase beta subunit
VYERAALPPDFVLNGPAIFEEYGSTKEIFPVQQLSVDQHGILVVRPAAQDSGVAR